MGQDFWTHSIRINVVLHNFLMTSPRGTPVCFFMSGVSGTVYIVDRTNEGPEKLTGLMHGNKVHNVNSYIKINMN